MEMHTRLLQSNKDDSQGASDKPKKPDTRKMQDSPFLQSFKASRAKLGYFLNACLEEGNHKSTSQSQDAPQVRKHSPKPGYTPSQKNGLPVC